MAAKEHPTTLHEYLTLDWRDKGQGDGLGDVIMAIANGSSRVQQEVRQAALADALGTTGETNVQGEIVQQAGVLFQVSQRGAP